MFVAFYHGVSDGWPGLIDRSIQSVLAGDFSHCEIVFEPGDGVEQFVDDKNLEPDATGAYWSASASMMDYMPEGSPRQGKLGGVRFKRIRFSSKNWTCVPVHLSAYEAAKFFYERRGKKYAIKGTLSHALKFLRFTPGTYNCSLICAGALGYPEGFRFDPCNLFIALATFNALMGSQPLEQRQKSWIEYVKSFTRENAFDGWNTLDWPENYLA